MYQEIEVLDYMNDIVKNLRKGITITPTVDGVANPMTISWGHIGVEWNKLTFITYVRGSRHTFSMLETAKSFTVNIPIDESAKEIIKFCGSNSGRDIDKAKELNLETIPTREIDGFGYKQAPLTLECKVVYRQSQDKNQIPKEFVDKFYSKEISDHDNFHTMFYGEIVDAYILK